MPRQARIDIPGLLQHVIVCGVAQAEIFTDDQDRADFVSRLGSLLGGGDFVEQVLGAEAMPDTSKLSLAELIALVAGYYQLSAADLALPCRFPQYVKARAVICYFAMRHLRLPAAVIRPRLSYTASAVSKAARQGQKLYREDAHLQALLG